MTLGLTTTRYTLPDETLVSGTVQIVRKPDADVVRQVITHELGHAYSYSNLTKAQRTWFVGELGKIDAGVTVGNGFSGDDYAHAPSEQWARGMATCLGYGDGFRRPTASCGLIEQTKGYAGP